LGRGFLTGQVTRETITDGDMRGSNPRFSEEAMKQNLAIVDRVRAVADRNDATPGQVALAWLLAQHDRVVPIPGTRRIERLTQAPRGLSSQPRTSPSSTPYRHPPANATAHSGTRARPGGTRRLVAPLDSTGDELGGTCLGRRATPATEFQPPG